ncbi:glycosyl transferase [bacterium CG_4_9_14_3_um_filter_65_15]|nr:MAG: glycosyl transferase [bacterium CG_4_9_14_3_um_filter_65_15]
MSDSDRSPVTSGAGLINGSAVLTGTAPQGLRYSVLVRADGTGFSRCDRDGRPLALTAWNPGNPPNRQGLVFFLRDRDSGEFWALGADPRHRTASWHPGHFIAGDERRGIVATLDTRILPGLIVENRRLTLTNRSSTVRRLDITSLAEIVLNDPAAHEAHPVFSKLFLQTRYLRDQRTLLVRRRPRGADESPRVLFHALLGAPSTEPTFETDRARFFGRGRPWSAPAALTPAAELSGSIGNILDPVVSLRCPFDLDPGQTLTLDFLLGIADDETAAAGLVEHCGSKLEILRAMSGDTVTDLAAPLPEVEYTQHLGAVLMGGDRRFVVPRSPAAGDPRARLGALGLDPDLPLVTVLQDRENRWEKVAAIKHALGLDFQMVVAAPGAAATPGARILADAAPQELVQALVACSGLVVEGSWPEASLLRDQAAVAVAIQGPEAPIAVDQGNPAVAAPDPEREFANGLGGFTALDHAYAMTIACDDQGHLRLPPQPWINVLANDNFGCLVSETGAGCTWFGNSREHRLTPWFNDPVFDPHADALYLRDDDDGAYFSCLPGPTPAGGRYTMAHGFGYSHCRRRPDAADLETGTLLTVAADDPVRITTVTVTNHSSRPRNLSLFAYQQLVMGATPHGHGRFVATTPGFDGQGLLAQNPTAGPFRDAVAFAAVAQDDHVLAVHSSGDRRSFLGAACDPARPAALATPELDPSLGGGLDPCFALQALIRVPAGETVAVTFLLGEGGDRDHAKSLYRHYTRPGSGSQAAALVREFWRNGLQGLQISTPSRPLDLMVNGWLGYQTLACRIRARSAFYQSGGAFGFRDQLQDSLSLMPLWPELTRNQILLHASHQFIEGDVLHWWHPPHDGGIRTRFVDDLLWLPFALVDYVRQTGDAALLDESAPYLTGTELEPGQDEVFVHPQPSGQSASVYEHCCLALDRSLGTGGHGLPLFGTGDWNDGMNRVGREGRGESVWMGFFLVTIIDGFVPLCEKRGDHDRAARYRAHRGHLTTALNDVGWDGSWYRRGYYDDGAPLGSSANSECRIDALAQAWSVLSGVAPADRAEQAMAALQEHLIDREHGLIRLLAPPFVDSPHDPGYIKGYVAGVRENGGQYTHAALWVIRALAEMGRRNEAADLLDMINPIRHTQTPEDVKLYELEPYVMAADVYGADPHIGRGGWSWYTGSSGWMLRVAYESILGLRPEGDTLVVKPCVPDSWPGYSLTWRIPGPDETRYTITVDNPTGCSEAVVAVALDGSALDPVNGSARLPLASDGRHHVVAITLGAARGPVP